MESLQMLVVLLNQAQLRSQSSLGDFIETLEVRKKMRQLFTCPAHLAQLTTVTGWFHPSLCSSCVLLWDGYIVHPSSIL